MHMLGLKLFECALEDAAEAIRVGGVDRVPLGKTGSSFGRGCEHQHYNNFKNWQDLQKPFPACSAP